MASLSPKAHSAFAAVAEAVFSLRRPLWKLLVCKPSPIRTHVTSPLPVPLPQHILAFQALYERKWGVALSGEEAHKALTALMQFVYLRDLYLTDQRVEVAGHEPQGQPFL